VDNRHTGVTLYHGDLLNYLEVVGKPEPAAVLGGVTAGSELQLAMLTLPVDSRSRNGAAHRRTVVIGIPVR
jgi:hypothetical protein